jgi:hypothetical protein
MPPIKITLPRLIELFGKSVGSDLPEPVRALAARNMTLVAHVIRIEQKSDAKIKELSAQITTLTEIIQALMPAQQAAPAAAPPAASTTAPVAAANAAAPIAEQAEEEGEESEDDFFERVKAEAEAEVAALNAEQPPEEAITVLPTRKGKAGGAK